jgi:hypothetical protein
MDRLLKYSGKDRVSAFRKAEEVTGLSEGIIEKDPSKVSSKQVNNE